MVYNECIYNSPIICEYLIFDYIIVLPIHSLHSDYTESILIEPVNISITSTQKVVMCRQKH